jgi:hypothetical protein
MIVSHALHFWRIRERGKHWHKRSCSALVIKKWERAMIVPWFAGLV